MTASTVDINSGGYGAFWIANSVTSLFLGRRNRKLQEEANKRNEEFQLEMEYARNLTEDKRLQEEIAFKRRMHMLARQYRQEQLTESFNQQMRAIELKQYLTQYWPLNPSLPNTILQEKNHTKLNVILMHSLFLTPQRFGEPNNEDTNIFREIEYNVKQNDIPCIKSVDFWQDAALRPNGRTDISGGNASVMNIHFLMSQLPTLVVYPYYDKNKMHFNGAVWEAQAARPLMRSLLSFDFNPFEIENDKNKLKNAKELFRSAFAVITGAVRDSYIALTQGQEPTLPVWLNDDNHKEMKQIVQNNQEIKQFLTQEYESIVSELDYEKKPNLLDVFAKEDIDKIRDKFKSNQLKM